MTHMQEKKKEIMMQSKFHQIWSKTAGRGRFGALIPFFATVLLLTVTTRAAADWERKCPRKPDDIRAARSLASRLYRTGITHYKQGRYEVAEHYFRCTQTIIPAFLTRYWIGRAVEKQGKHDKALSIYLEVEKNPPKVVDIEDLRSRIVRLGEIVGEGIGAGDPDSGKTDKPAAYDDSGVAKDKHAREKEARDRKAEGFHYATVYRRHRSMEIVAWTTWSAGAVMIITGTVLGSLALHDQRKIENASDGVYWDSTLERRYERRQSLVPGAWVCIGLGIGAVASGTLLYLFGRKEMKEVSAAAWHVVPLKGGAAAGVRLRY